MTVCKEALSMLDLPSDWRVSGYPIDPTAGIDADFYAHPGVQVRLTRNLDKDRGFVNGALGTVKRVLLYDEEQRPIVFTVKLVSGTMVLVHPIRIKKQLYLPCTYGYATTIRKAQGATIHHGMLYFDHYFPPERGY